MVEPVVFIPIKTILKWIKFIKTDEYWNADIAKEDMVKEMEYYIIDKEGFT